MGTLANRLDKLDNKFGLIEREAGSVAGGRGCEILPVSLWAFVSIQQTPFVSLLVLPRLEVATIAAMTEEFVHNTDINLDLEYKQMPSCFHLFVRWFP